MLYHHGNRNYEAQASEAAAAAVKRMEALFAKGAAGATSVIEKVQREVPFDQIVKARGMNFQFVREEVLATELDVAEDKARQVGEVIGHSKSNLVLEAGDTRLGFHKHAQNQLCSRAGIPAKFAANLTGREAEWASDLLANNLNELYAHDKNSYLVRSVDEQARGFLSNRYRRLDSRPILDAFCGAAQNIGAQPVEGWGSDTKILVKALIPRIYEPVPNEVMCFGVSFENSDFGNGSLAVRVFCMRLWCTNFAIADEGLRQVHLGKRLSDEITFSEKTYQLDTDTSASAVNDIVAHGLGDDAITEFCEAVKAAADKPVTMNGAATLLRTQLSKGELDKVGNTFESQDVINVPEGNTTYRLSNCVSWIAQQADTPERKLELEKIAGSILKVKAAA